MHASEDGLLGRLDRSLLRDRVYRMLCEAIVHGELAPGKVVRDAELAERNLRGRRSPPSDAAGPWPPNIVPAPIIPQRSTKGV